MRRITTILVALVLLTSGCSDDEPETAVGALDEGGAARVELVTGEPFEATAWVDDMLDEHAFLLLDTLVLSRTRIEVTEDDMVRVTGEVENASALSSDLLGLLGNDARDAVSDHDVVVVASVVEVVDEEPED